MAIYIFDSNKLNDIKSLIRLKKNILVYNYAKDYKEINDVYNDTSIRKQRICMKLMPLNWDNLPRYISLPNITFSGIEQFDTIYVHKFIYPGYKEWEFMLSKFKDKEIIFSISDDPFTWQFIESGLDYEEFTIINSLNFLNKKDRFKQKMIDLIDNNCLPF